MRSEGPATICYIYASKKSSPDVELQGWSSPVAHVRDIVGVCYADECVLCRRYEGTYDVNVLVSGRDITGSAAFRPAGQKPAKGKA